MNHPVFIEHVRIHITQHLMRYALFLLLLHSTCLLILHAKESNDGFGTLRGKVHDSVTKEPLVGVTISLIGTRYGTASDLNGNFIIRNIPSGSYLMKVSSVGYTPRVIPDVIIGTGSEAQFDIAMELAPIDAAEVVVEADYFQKLNDALVSVQSLSYEEIRRSPGGQEDVIRAISVLPGVVQVSAGRNDLIVRGGAASENLYVVENVEIPNINHFGTQGSAGGPLSFINLDFVRDVTFSTGGFGVRYGDKLSSVLNIELKDGRTDRFGSKATISATQFGLNSEGPLGQSGSYLFSVRRSYLDWIFKAAGFGFVPEYWDLLGKATYNLDQSNQVSFLTIGALDKVRFFNDTEDKRFSNSRILGNSQNQYISAISWRHLFTKGFATISLGRSYVDYDFLQTDSLLQPIFQSASHEGETSLRADAVLLPDNNFEISFGAQGKIIRTRGNLNSMTNPYFPSGTSFESAWEKTGVKASVYAQVSRTFFDHLIVNLGGRMDYFNLLDRTVAIAPRASVTYQVAPATSLNFSAGIYTQTPSMIWLTSNSDNARLTHIHVQQMIVGIEHLLRTDTKLRVEGYWKNYLDYPANVNRPYLVMSNTGAGFGGAEEGFASFGFEPLISEGSGVSRGIELLVQKRLSEIPCYGIVSLSYNQTDFVALDGVKRPGSYDQRLILNLSGGYKLSDAWEFGTKFRIGTGTPYTPFLSNGTPDYARFNSERLPVFHSLDLRVDRRWNFSSWNLITYIDIQNVYNRTNVQSYRWDFRNQKVESGSNTIGILPTIGISAEL